MGDFKHGVEYQNPPVIQNHSWRNRFRDFQYNAKLTIFIVPLYNNEEFPISGFKSMARLSGKTTLKIFFVNQCQQLAKDHRIKVIDEVIE
jgi:hypothetical protein